ncbi:hypothetical protein [Pedobacter kyungheensis]|uniref:hypothetical protein n=1 Tax=Pedobacter kyungheensis TaxID=1069985 RepID=UPI001427A7B0|nr:hypothetical protein [Pedobacter kyungheensis]
MIDNIRIKRVNLLFALTILWLTGSAQDLQTVTQNGNSTSLGINTGAASSIFGVNFSLANTYTKKLVPTGFNFWLSNGAEDGKLIMPYNSSENARFHNLGLSIDKNVGIGTTSPLTGLQLGNLGSEIAAKQISIPGVYNFETVKLGQIGNGNSALEFVNHSGQNTSYGMRLTTNIDNGGTGLQFQYAGSQNNYELLNYQTGMFLGITGSVGIGTTIPTTKLEVTTGNNYDQLSLTKTTIEGDKGAGIVFKNTVNNGSTPEIGGIQAKLLDGGTGYVKGSLSLYTVNNETKIEAITIRPQGNVGIGIATPDEKLAVNGKIRAKEIKVEASNWPDYVFEEDYKVGTLEGLESYIKTNKHLPEVPNAKEVEANGVALGEMNKLLLKKIEELTLYVIELKKENVAQQKQLDQLQKTTK